nr:uracil DNA glycosylase [Hymenolepis microstoma]
MIDQTSRNYRPSPNEIEQIKASEMLNRRKMRILRVRHLSKIHSSFTRKLYNEKLQKRLYQEAQNLRKQQITSDKMLLRKKQRALDCVMESFGNAHQVASFWKDPILEEEKRQFKSELAEKKRYEKARIDLKLARAKSQREAEMRRLFRETALDTERKRAAAIAALPSPQPDPLEPHFKQTCAGCTLCPREKPKEYHIIVEVDSPQQQNLTGGGVRMRIEKDQCDVNVSRCTGTTSENAGNAFDAALAENERTEIEQQRAARIAAEASLKAQIRDQLALKRVQAMQEYQQLVQQIDPIPTTYSSKAHLTLSDEESFKHQEGTYPCSDLARLGPGERAYLQPLMVSVHQSTSFQQPQSSHIPEQSINEEIPHNCNISMDQIREDSQETGQYAPKSENIRFATRPEIVELEGGCQIVSSKCRELSDYERKKMELDSEVECLDREIQEIRELYTNNVQTNLPTQGIGEKLPPQEHASESLLQMLDEPTILESTEHRLDEINVCAISNNGDNEVHRTEPCLLPSSDVNEQSPSVKVQADEVLKLDTTTAERVQESFDSSDSMTLTASPPSTPSIKDEKKNTFITAETVKTKIFPISDSLRRRAAELIHRQKERIRSLKEGAILTPPSSGISSGSSTDFELPPPPSPPQNEYESSSTTISLNSRLSPYLYVSTPVDTSLGSSARPVVDNQSEVERTARSIPTKQQILRNYLRQLLGSYEGKVAPLPSDDSGDAFATHSQSNNSFVPFGVSKPPKFAITNLSVITEEDISQHSNITRIQGGVASISLDPSRSNLDNTNASNSSSRNAKVDEPGESELNNGSGVALSPLMLGLTHFESDAALKTSSSGHSSHNFTELSSLSSKVNNSTDNKEIIQHSWPSPLNENESSLAVSSISINSTNSKSDHSIKIGCSDQKLGHLTETLSHTPTNSQINGELDLTSVSSGSMKRKIAVIKPRSNESREQAPSSNHSSPSVNHPTPHRKIAILKSAKVSESGGVRTIAKSDLIHSNSGACPSANFQLWSNESVVFSGSSNATLMVKSPTPDAAAGGCVIKSPIALTCTPSPNRNGVWFKSAKYNLQYLGSGESPQILANSLETISTLNSSSRPSNQFSTLSSASSACKMSPPTTLQFLQNENSSDLQRDSFRSSQQRQTSISTMTHLKRQDEPLSPISSDLSSLLFTNNSSSSSSCKDELSSEKIKSPPINRTQIQPEISCQVMPRSSTQTECTPNTSSRPSDLFDVLSSASSPCNDSNHPQNSHTATTLEILREGLSSDGQTNSYKSSQQGSTSASTLTLLKRHREPSSFLQSDLNNLDNSPAATTLSILRDGLSTMDIQNATDRSGHLQRCTSASTLTLLRRHELSSILCSNNSNDKEKAEPFRKTSPAFDIRRQESTQSSKTTHKNLPCESFKSNSYWSTTETSVKYNSSSGWQEIESDSSCANLDNPTFYSTIDFCFTTNGSKDLKECGECEETDCEDEITMTSCLSCNSSLEQGRCHEEDSVACAIKNVLNASRCSLDGRTATRFYSATSCKAIEFSVTPQISSPNGINTSPTVNVKATASNKVLTEQFISNKTRKVNGKTFIDLANEEDANGVKFNATISFRSAAAGKHGIAGSEKGTSGVVPTRTTYDKSAGKQGRIKPHINDDDLRENRGEETGTLERRPKTPGTDKGTSGVVPLGTRYDKSAGKQGRSQPHFNEVDDLRENRGEEMGSLEMRSKAPGADKETAKVITSGTRYDKSAGKEERSQPHINEVDDLGENRGEEMGSLEMRPNAPETEIVSEEIHGPSSEMNKAGPSVANIHGQADYFKSAVPMHPFVKSNDVKIALEEGIEKQELESDIAKLDEKQDLAASNMAQIGPRPLKWPFSIPIKRTKQSDLEVHRQDVLGQRSKSGPSEEYLKVSNRDAIDQNSLPGLVKGTSLPEITSVVSKVGSNFKGKSKNDLPLLTNVADHNTEISIDPKVHLQDRTSDSAEVLKRPMASHESDGRLGKSSSKRSKLELSISVEEPGGTFRSTSVLSLDSSLSDLNISIKKPRRHKSDPKIDKSAKPVGAEFKISPSEKSPLRAKYGSLPEDLPDKAKLEIEKYGSSRSIENAGSKLNSVEYGMLPDVPTDSISYQSTDRKAKFEEKKGLFEPNEKYSEDPSAQFTSEEVKHIPTTHFQRSRLFRSKTTSKDVDMNFDDAVDYKEDDIRDGEVKPVYERLKQFEPGLFRKVRTQATGESEQNTRMEGYVQKFDSLEDEHSRDLQRVQSTVRDNKLTGYSPKEGQTSTLEAYQGIPTRSTNEYPVDARTKIPLKFGVDVIPERSQKDVEKHGQRKIAEENMRIMDDHLASASSSKNVGMTEADGLRKSIEVSPTQGALLKNASLKIAKPSSSLKSRPGQSPSFSAKSNLKTGSKSPSISRGASPTIAYGSRSQRISGSPPYIPSDLVRHLEDSVKMNRNVPAISTSKFKSISSRDTYSKGNRSVSPAKRPNSSLSKIVSPKDARSRDLSLEGSKATAIVSPGFRGLIDNLEIDSNAQIKKFVTSSSGSKPVSKIYEGKRASDILSRYKPDQRENLSSIASPISPTPKPVGQKHIVEEFSKYNLDIRGNRSVSPLSKHGSPRNRGGKVTAISSTKRGTAVQQTTTPREKKTVSTSAKSHRDLVSKSSLASKILISPKLTDVSPSGKTYNKENAGSSEVSPKKIAQSKIPIGKSKSPYSAEAVGAMKPIGNVAQLVKSAGLTKHRMSPSPKIGILDDFRETSPIAKRSPNAAIKGSTSRSLDGVRRNRSKSPRGKITNQQKNMRKTIPVGADLRGKGSRSPGVKSNRLDVAIDSETGETKEEISGIPKMDSSLIDHFEPDNDAPEEIENFEDMVSSLSVAEAAGTKNAKVINTEERAIKKNRRPNVHSAKKTATSVKKSLRTKSPIETKRRFKTPRRPIRHRSQSKVKLPMWKRKHAIRGRPHTLPKLKDKHTYIASKSKPMVASLDFLTSDTTSNLSRKEEVTLSLKESESTLSVSGGQSNTVTPTYVPTQNEMADSSSANWTMEQLEAQSKQSSARKCVRSEPICKSRRQRLFSLQVEEVLSANFPFERFRIRQSLLKFIKRPAGGSTPLEEPSEPSSKISKCTPNTESFDCAKLRVEVNKSVAQMKLNLPCSVKTLIKYMNAEWCYHLSTVIRSESFKKLANFIENERLNGTIYPPQDEVFTWSKLTPPGKVRVVILGQDPYHGPHQAHGLAFSVKQPQRPPPSLVNMYKEIASDCSDSISSNWPPSHGDLTRWAEQGVLLLNAVLTVRASQPNSHKDQGWENLTSAVVKHINQNCSNVVFLLWGANAQAQGAGIDKKKHLVLQAPHPSPFSANRGFFGCQHFSKANAYLKEHGLEAINWTDLG